MSPILIILSIIRRKPGTVLNLFWKEVSFDAGHSHYNGDSSRSYYHYNQLYFIVEAMLRPVDWKRITFLL
jgi:hypothetical protein